MTMPDKRCCCCDHRFMDVITRNTQSFSLTIVTCCFFKVPWKRFYFILFSIKLLFSFYALKKISQVHRNYPSLITFSQLWRNSSQLAHLFKVKVALSPDLNTARWFAKMDLSASVQKQQGHLLASAVKLVMPWKWTIPAFLTKLL